MFRTVKTPGRSLNDVPRGAALSLRPFVRDRRGAITLTFALLLLPLLAAIGLAIDFGNVMTMRTKAQMAADAAALQAAGTAKDLISAGGRTEPEILLAVLKAKQRGLDLFNAHAQQMGLKDYTVDVVVTRDGVKLSAVVNFSLNSPNVISKVVGYNAFKAAGMTGAAASLPAFTDVYLALDISQSMGIASTKAGMNTLYYATGTMKNAAGKSINFNKPINCVFGCHLVGDEVKQAGYVNPDGSAKFYWTESFVQIAKRVGVPLRIDVLRDATKAMIATAQKNAGTNPIYRLALYTMGMNATFTQQKLTELSAITNDFASLSSAANGIDLMASKNTNAESYIAENLATFATKIPAPGDGSNQAGAKKFALIVTDGLRNILPLTSNTCTFARQRCISTVVTKDTISPSITNPLNSTCEALKKAGVTVGVLYTTYLPIDPIDTAYPQEDWYTEQPLAGVGGNIQKVGDDLKKCASPGWFYQASDADAIKAAMAQMFEQTTTVPTLVN